MGWQRKWGYRGSTADSTTFTMFIVSVILFHFDGVRECVIFWLSSEPGTITDLDYVLHGNKIIHYQVANDIVAFYMALATENSMMASDIITILPSMGFLMKLYYSQRA